MRFNYLRDAPPALVEQIREFRVPLELRTPIAAIITAMIVVTAWSLLEHYWMTQAAGEEALATIRLEESREAFAATKLVRSDVTQLLDLDGRLRRIRLSGSALSLKLADIGNHVPSRAWLTSIARTNDGLELRGQAEGLNVLSATVADLMMSKFAASPTLVRAVRDDRSPAVIGFTIHAEGMGR